MRCCDCFISSETGVPDEHGVKNPRVWRMSMGENGASGVVSVPSIASVGCDRDSNQVEVPGACGRARRTDRRQRL